MDGIDSVSARFSKDSSFTYVYILSTHFFSILILFSEGLFSVGFWGQPPNFGAVLFGAGRLTRAEEGALDPIVVGGVSHNIVEMKSRLRCAPVS